MLFLSLQVAGPVGAPGSVSSTRGSSDGTPGMPSTSSAEGPVGPPGPTTTATPACVPYRWERNISVDAIGGVAMFELDTSQEHDQMVIEVCDWYAEFAKWYYDRRENGLLLSLFQTLHQM